MSTPAPKQREVWVDTARCLAMATIMSLHSGADARILGTPVGGAICLFFVLAGYFMPRHPGQAALRALRLGLAWLLWSIISLGLYILVQPGIAWDWAHAFGIGTFAYNTPLWFLKDLCIFQGIIAGLAALRILPRYTWYVLAILVCCTYAADPPQHESLHFDWLPAVLLGYALRTLPLTRLRTALQRHAPLLVATGALLLLQREYYPQLLQNLDIRSAACSLPVGSLVWSIWYALAAVKLEQLLPRAADLLARTGSCMLFIYAAHSLAYAPFYHLSIAPAWGVPIMLLLMGALTITAHQLQRLCPLGMRLLTAAHA